MEMDTFGASQWISVPLNGFPTTQGVNVSVIIHTQEIADVFANQIQTISALSL